MGTHRKIRCLVKRCFGMLQITEIYLTETVALESLVGYTISKKKKKKKKQSTVTTFSMDITSTSGSCVRFF